MSLTSQQEAALSRLGLANAPVAVTFVANAPDGLSRIDRSLPASCSYWTEASSGHSFYTAAEDHTNCPVGAFTHGVSLTEQQAGELHSLIGVMTELKYVRKEEIPLIPHRTSAMQFAVYTPLAHAASTPDAVIFRGNARQIMLLSEAARAAGVFDAGAVMGRPACAMLPQTLSAQAGIASVGCIGNRVYTGLGDDELYLTVPGSAVGRVLDHLETVLTANTALEQFHQNRAAQLSS